MNAEVSSPSRRGLTLICIDSSEHSICALEWYFENIYQSRDEVGLAHVHVLPDMSGFGLFGRGIYNEVHSAQYFKDGKAVPTPFNQREITESVKASQTLVEREKRRFSQKGVSVKAFVETMQDSIGHTVCDIAKKQNAECIILGQRGLGKIRRTLLGSVSDYVLHHIHIPVIVVPPLPKD